MANLTGRAQIFRGDTSIIDADIQHQLGTRAMDVDGNEYIYLQGVASVVAGSWVVFDEDYVTTRTVANSKGRVAVAMAAIATTSDYGWFQVYGKNTIALAISGGAAAADAQVFLTSTAGQVDDVDVATDLVTGALFRVAESSGVVTVELNYPMCLNVVYN